MWYELKIIYCWKHHLEKNHTKMKEYFNIKILNYSITWMAIKTKYCQDHCTLCTSHLCERSPYVRGSRVWRLPRAVCLTPWQQKGGVLAGVGIVSVLAGRGRYCQYKQGWILSVLSGLGIVSIRRCGYFQYYQGWVLSVWARVCVNCKYYQG